MRTTWVAERSMRRRTDGRRTGATTGGREVRQRGTGTTEARSRQRPARSVPSYCAISSQISPWYLVVVGQGRRVRHSLPPSQATNCGLGIITSPNFQGSAGSLCVRCGRGGNLCPAHTNRHISPGTSARALIPACTRRNAAVEREEEKEIATGLRDRSGRGLALGPTEWARQN